MPNIPKGQEVSCVAIEVHLRIAERKAIPIEKLLEGLAITEVEARDAKSRLSWDDYCTISDRLETLIGGSSAFEEEGQDFMEGPKLKGLVKVAGLFCSVGRLYWVSAEFGGGRLFPHIETEYEKLGPESHRFSVTIPKPYRPCHSFFHFSAGTLRGLPRVLHQPDAQVRYEINGGRCDFYVKHAASKTLWARLRGAFAVIFAAESVYAELRAQNDELLERLTEVQTARREAEAAAQVKADFLRNMSHELRTPMNGIVGAAQLLGEEPMSDDATVVLGDLRASSDRMMTLVERLLAFSTPGGLESIELKAEPMDLRALLDDVARSQLPSCQDKGLSLSVQVDLMVPQWVCGDRGRLHEALTVLMGNAVQFTEQGAVRVGASMNEGRVRIEVEDSGVGVNADARNKIFAPFSQADSSMTRKKEGVGLGLTVCRQIIKAMGGTIDFESTMGAGSTFWIEVTLPKAEAPVQAAEVQLPKVQLVPPPEPSEPKAAEPEAVEAVEPEAVEPEVVEPKILIVEDNRVNQRMLERMVQRTGFMTEVANNGREALHRLEEGRYSLILMDCQMPELDGYEATRMIREHPEAYGHAPIVAVTAHNMQGDRERCFEAGMNDFMAKPVKSPELKQMLQKYLELKAAC